MQADYIAGASTGLKTANKLHSLAQEVANNLTPEAIDPDDVRKVAALTQTANQAAQMGTAMLNSHKEETKPQEMTFAELVGSIQPKAPK